MRAGFWRDQGGSKSGLDQTLTDTTGTFEVRFTEHASMRFEWRHDQSNRAFFSATGASVRDTTRTRPPSS